MIRCIKTLVKDRFGTAALEFALVVPVVIALLAGTVEFAMVGFRISLLEGGLREAARFGTTGSTVEETETREETIINMVNLHSAGLFTVTPEQLSTLVYPDFDKIGQSEPFTDTNGNDAYDTGEPFTDVNCNTEWDVDMGLAGSGGGEEVVLYTVNVEVDSMTGLFDSLITDDGKISLSATIAIRNEPFPGGVTVCP